MFIGLFKLNIPDNTSRTEQAVTDVVSTEGKYNKTNFKPTADWVKNLHWEIEFKLLCANTCGATKVQYLLVEISAGHVAPPMRKGNVKPAEWVSENSAKNKLVYYYNRGLMSLLDILYTPKLYMMKSGPGATKFPNGKRGNYIKSKVKKKQAGFSDFFEILNNVCKLMENFILYQVKDSIVWERDQTWPMRQWMTHIAHALNALGARL